MKYILEHLDGRLYKWCWLEYKHASDTVGKKNIIFTNVKGTVAASKLETIGRVGIKSVITQKLKNVCVLDPQASKVLTTADCKKFDYMIFGGVLGNHPMDGRTKTALSDNIKCSVRNLGPVQMSTNTAVLVVKMIADGAKFSEIKFIDEIEIETGKNESQIFPYRYVLKNGKPVLPDGLIEFLKKRRGF
ncbi:hypothetical protein HN419_07815 [Candidatus Woesearchaeota archaeon]|jgi:ribosome biogenesis SPOUT family RNA methylase Rps3|nr:hypothetical protein [Candidatus Woesearchaeota archaeon]MBT3538397.1 hypothetical protein [Candidatus Woesearchaeota archaeon]MBT4697064.1 hypothetical protein [Candidatus Woesearchaeota archaeon]MBT4716390.1 hypothetical protein [Candidatus Woesearchaeota archaeon]MBT7106066.1 hypothetical protein [Candidatus Woesearchaeota archaeon]